MLNILVTLDSRYMKALRAMLTSVMKSNGKESINLYVAYSSLTEEDFESIERITKAYDTEIYRIKLDDGLFEGAPNLKRLSKAAYYRIFAPLYLPKSVDRILYMDPDTAVINSLSSFYSMDFDGQMIIGAKHFDGFVDRWNKSRLFIKKSRHYINDGIMLMNIEGMRKVFSQESFMELLRKKHRILFLGDQDAVNIYYDGKIKYANEYIINLDERCFKRLSKEHGEEKAMELVKSETVIIHFNGKYKPWNEGYKGYLDCFYTEAEETCGVID